MEEKRFQLDLHCAAGGLLLFLLAPWLLAVLVAAAPLPPSVNLLLRQCPVHLGMILLAYFSAKHFLPERSVAETLSLEKTPDFSVPDTLKRFAVMFVCLTVLSICTDFLSKIFSLNLPSQVLVSKALTGSWGTFSVIAFTSIVLAPVSEELLFRGALYRVVHHFCGDRVSLVIPALIFAVLHANLLQLIPLFVMGLLLQRAYCQTGTLRTPILMHSLNNLCTILWLLILRSL